MDNSELVLPQLSVETEAVDDVQSQSLAGFKAGLRKVANIAFTNPNLSLAASAIIGIPLGLSSPHSLPLSELDQQLNTAQETVLTLDQPPDYSAGIISYGLSPTEALTNTVTGQIWANGHYTATVEDISIFEGTYENYGGSPFLPKRAWQIEHGVKKGIAVDEILQHFTDKLTWRFGEYYAIGGDEEIEYFDKIAESMVEQTFSAGTISDKDREEKKSELALKLWAEKVKKDSEILFDQQTSQVFLHLPPIDPTPSVILTPTLIAITATPGSKGVSIKATPTTDTGSGTGTDGGGSGGSLFPALFCGTMIGLFGAGGYALRRSSVEGGKNRLAPEDPDAPTHSGRIVDGKYMP